MFMNATRAYNLFSADFGAAYLTTMRPYLLFVSGITGVAAMALVHDVQPVIALLVFFASFLAYGFGQALTDCFQIDTDSVSSPYRPLTKGTITTKQVMIVSAVGLTVCVSIFAVLFPLNLVFGVLCAAGLALYTPFKRRWWGGPWYNSWIVLLLGLMAFQAAGGTLYPPTSLLVPTAGAIFFGYANFVLGGYFKDIEADRQTGYETFPVLFGRRKAARVSSVFAGLFCLSLAYVRVIAPVSDLWSGPILVSWLLFVAALATALTAQVRLHVVQTDNEAHPAIGLIVHTYILGLSFLASVSQPAWWPFLLFFYGAFIVVLQVRPSRSQI